MFAFRGEPRCEREVRGVREREREREKKRWVCVWGGGIHRAISQRLAVVVYVDTIALVQGITVEMCKICI